MRIITAVLISMFVAASLSSAQDEEQPSNYPHLEDAEWLIGTWKSEGIVPKGDLQAGQKYVFRVNQQWILDKNVIDAELKWKAANASFVAKVLIGWNPSTKKITTTSFSSLGGHGAGVVQLSKDRMIVKDSGFNADGTPMSYTVELIRRDKDTIARSVTNRKEGDKKLPDIKDTLHRVKKD